MSNHHSYHLALKRQAISPLEEKVNSKNVNHLTGFNNLINPTKNFINYYYDYVHSKSFNVKNSAYYNQLIKSANFLNNEVLNNWTHDVLALASINNLNFPTLSPTSGLHIPSQFINDEPKSILDLNLNLKVDWNSSLRENHIHGFNNVSSISKYYEEEIFKNKEAIKNFLIDYNNDKNEKIIEDNLKKSYEKNIYTGLKLKSDRHHSLHFSIPSSGTVENIETVPVKKPETEIETTIADTKDSSISDAISPSDLEDKELLKEYASHPNYVFGYGSLINPDSRGRTVDSTKSARVYKVLAKGLERSWNYNCRDVYTAVGVAKVDDLSVTCNGVIIPIDDPINDIPKFDEREKDYRRVKLSRENISIIHDQRNEGIKDEDLLESDAIIWVYEIVDTFIPTTEIPISQIYIDCIILGCIKEGGIEFARQFISNTQGWNTSVWVNDRTSEHFRKNIPRCLIKLDEEIISSIDSLLTSNLSSAYSFLCSFSHLSNFSFLPI